MLKWKSNINANKGLKIKYVQNESNKLKTLKENTNHFIKMNKIPKYFK
jgi:hypothetical protein